jgi:hypothetical protein
MLHTSQPGSQRAVDQEMASKTVLLGMSAGNLRNYLVEYRDLHVGRIHSELNRMLHKNQPGSQKAVDEGTIWFGLLAISRRDLPCWFRRLIVDSASLFSFSSFFSEAVEL